MSASQRDLLKNKNARRGEVFALLGLKAGQANSQLVAFGGDITANSTGFDVSQTDYVLGQAVIAKAAQTAIALDSSADTGAGEYRKVLIELNASGTVSQKVGSKVSTSQADAPLPKGDTDKVSLGWLELPPSFTHASTTVTSGMIKKMPYWDPAA